MLIKREYFFIAISVTMCNFGFFATQSFDLNMRLKTDNNMSPLLKSCRMLYAEIYFMELLR